MIPPSGSTLVDEFRAGWVLVGGQSRRMGADKAMLAVNGVPLAINAVAKVREVCSSVTLVGDPERYGNLGVPVIGDNFPGQGPLAGIEAALRVTTADWNLVVACDMPALDPAILENLFATGADCAVPRYPNGKIEPLCVVYRRHCHAVIREALESGVRKVSDAFALLAERHALRYVAVSCPEPFTNLNTPEDLRQYKNA